MFLSLLIGCRGARGSVVGWGTMLQALRSRVRVPMRWIFSQLTNPYSCTTAVGSTQPLREMSNRNLPAGKREAGAWGSQPYRHLWADCLKKICEPRRLTTLWASTACYSDSFTFLLPYVLDVESADRIFMELVMIMPLMLNPSFVSEFYVTYITNMAPWEAVFKTRPDFFLIFLYLFVNDVAGSNSGYIALSYRMIRS
jgi:hypothetical protein